MPGMLLLFEHDLRFGNPALQRFPPDLLVTCFWDFSMVLAARLMRDRSPLGQLYCPHFSFSDLAPNCSSRVFVVAVAGIMDSSKIRRGVLFCAFCLKLNLYEKNKLASKGTNLLEQPYNYHYQSLVSFEPVNSNKNHRIFR